MALAADQMQVMMAGDQAFYRVDTLTPAHELPAGTAAAAVNCRFDEGQARPRQGVVRQPWGQVPSRTITGINLLADQGWPANPLGLQVQIIVTGFVIGQSYYLSTLGDATSFYAAREVNASLVATGNSVTPGFFVATQTTYLFFGTGNGTPLTAVLYGTVPPNAIGFARFNDPQSFDTCILLTDDWRSNVGEDGGRGRAWRIQSGNAPQEVPLNGHDVWGTTRIVPCFNGLVLLRQGNERHYFSASTTLAITDSDATADTIAADTDTLTNGQPVSVSGITGASGTYYARVASAGAVALYDTSAHAIAGGSGPGSGLFDVTADDETGTLTKLAVDPATSRIRLNSQPTWANGDKVTFYADTGSFMSGTTPPQNATNYFVKVISASEIELYTSSALATKLAFTTASGRFWLERNAEFPGFYGNAAPALLAQPDGAGATLWENGFYGANGTVLATNTDSATSIVTAPNHRLLPGDQVTVTGLQTTGPTAITSAYVYPVSDHAVRLYTTAAAALAQSSPIALIASGTGTLVKAGASGLPLPGGREGCYYQNRLLIVNGRDTLAVSDPLDPLHFTPFSAVTANLGEADRIMALMPMGTNDAVLILKENSVEVLNNFSSGPDQWTLTILTREYGCIAPLSVAQVGADVWFLSRKGVASIQQTVNGVLQGVAEPVSKPLKAYLDRVDWKYAANAAAGYWNNRFYLALPLKGQSGTPVNNGVLVFNFLNPGWEGLWQGDTLEPAAFARLSVYGEERLVFADATGIVSVLGDGYKDGNTAIATSLTTRRFTGGNQQRKLWLTTTLNFDAVGPNLTVTAIFPGVNETTAIVSGKTFDKTAYLVHWQSAYTPSGATRATWGAPYRADYQTAANELLVGQPDTHQNHRVPLRLRHMDWGMQIRVDNAAGSLRLNSLEVGGMLRETTSAETV